MSFDFDAAVVAPFRMQPGLRRLGADARHLSVARHDGRHLREKLAALGASWQQVLQCSPDFDAWPALHTLAAQAAAEHPREFAWDGRTATALHLGWSVRDDVAVAHTAPAAPHDEVGACLRRLPPEWRLAGLLSLSFAEDFAILDGREARVPWLAVALPSHWAPADKVGRHFAQIHAPVADGQTLRAAGDALARLVSSGTRWERFVWTITPHPHLNAHPAQPARGQWKTGDADGIAAQAWWRTERQTFLPVDGEAQALFTILVDAQPLAQALDSHAKALRVHDALASMSPAVRQYRGLSEVHASLLTWLARRASA